MTAMNAPTATAFTPGPWTVHLMFSTYVVPASDATKSIGGSIYPEQDARDYAKVIHSARPSSQPPEFTRAIRDAECRANAHLIAAAPDLYEAAKLTVLHFQRMNASDNFQGDDEHEAWTALNVAIAKAEGR